jgi:hypothetical protein
MSRPSGRLKLWLAHQPTRAAGIALAAEVVGSAILLIHYNRHLWFKGDDWSFLVGRQIDAGWAHALFAPHNEHWSTIPVLIFRALFSTVGLNHYLPYALPMIGAHLGVCILLWIALRRCGMNQWVAVSVVSVAAFLGAGSENLLWDFQIGFIGSVFFGLLAVVLADRTGPFSRSDLWSWAAAVAALLCSGIGVAAAVMLFVFSLLRRGWRTALALVSLPAATYAAWYLSIGHTGVHSSLADNLFHIPAYFWSGLTNAWERVAAIPGSGAVILIGLTIPLLASGVRDKAGQLAIGGLAAAAALYLIAGSGRAQYGAEQADSSRYLYIAVVFSLPALAWAVGRILHHGGSGNPVGAIVLVLIGALVAINGVGLLQTSSAARLKLSNMQRQELLGAESLIAANAPLLSSSVGPLIPDVTAARLERPDVRRAFGKVTPSRQGVLDAAAYLQVSVGPDRKLPGPTSLGWAGVGGTPPSVSPTTNERCVTAPATNPHAFVDLKVGASGSQVSLTFTHTAAKDVSVNTVLIDGTLQSTAVAWKAPADSPVFLASTAAGSTVRLMLPAASTVKLCLGE